MFGFPQIDRNEATVFTQNFLQSVIRQVRFDQNSLIVESKNEVAALLREILPRVGDVEETSFEIDTRSAKPVLRNSSSGIGYELKSIDGQKTLNVTKDSITYTVAGPVYRNYESFVQETDIIDRVLHMCKIDSVNRMALRKVNMIGFTYPQNKDANSIDFSFFILNRYLQTDYNSFPNRQFIQQSIQTVRYVSGSSTMNLKYGLVVPYSETDGQYVVDIDLYKSERTSVSDLRETLRLMNDEIFNVFNWVISDNAKDILKKQ